MLKKEQMESLMNAVIRRFVNDIQHKNCITNDKYGIELYIANIHMAYREYIKTLHRG